MATFTYLLAAAAVVAALAGRAECRPQTPETKEVEVVGGDNGNIEPGFQPLFPGEYGTVVGEILAHTGHLVVSKQDKKKKKEEQQKDGPNFSALVAGPPEASVGVASAGLTFIPSVAKVELVASAR